MHERILAVAAKLPRDKPSFQKLDDHPCISRVEYTPVSKQFTLLPTGSNVGNHVVLSQTALRKALRGTRYKPESPSDRLVARHDIKHSGKVVATIYTHLSHGKREVDFMHFDVDHFELLVRKIFGSDHDRESWPIRKRTTPLPVEEPKTRVAKPRNRRETNPAQFRR
ncbi:MAG: hypothetical protein Q8R15_03195 [Candidatus Micrarchaeota archaeon]|nr:hypothetical protein [Candidatus Micrarchaeota archaeon]